MSEDIIFERLGDIGLITLSRQTVLNALNHAMFENLNQQLMAWANDASIKAVLIRAAPGRAFSAGGDIRSVYERKTAGDTHFVKLFEDEYALNRRIFHYPKPYIAILDGITMGGGAGISIHGSHRIGTPRLSFAMPETAIGFFPDVGASYFLSRMPHFFGFYLGLTGERIDYQTCYALHLVNVIIPTDAEEDLLDDLSHLVEIDNILKKYAISVPPSDLWQHKKEIAFCFSHPTVEDIIIALEKGSEWGKKTAEIIQTKSPTSLKVTLKALQKGAQCDFDACMDMELRLMYHFIQSHDFFEGIRAQLIDKDRAPKWVPKTLQQVTPEDIQQYFA